jgi:cellulose synthase (UDP-forming)
VIYKIKATTNQTTEIHMKKIRFFRKTHVSNKKDIPYLLDVMTGRQKRTFYILVLFWFLNLSLMLEWWMNMNHVVDWFRFCLNSVLLFYMFALPGYMFFFIARMKRVNPEIEIPENWRIAMITTRAPTEPFSLVKVTLEAMLAQKFPHDTWLADEDPDDEIIEWCKMKGVLLSCRKGIPEYHRLEWPRRTKCKEGNLAYFYDHHGYSRYDFVSQLDSDHVPSEGYLEAMLRPFVNLEVGYVSAPSICDSKAKQSWAARGRLFAEAMMHGPLQAGHSAGFAPLCIESHYAVRTAALQEIGGLGPELAEDHSTTLMMNGSGWRGIHAIDAIANGEGPQTLADCITQEFQWSRSLMVILLTQMPKYWKKLPLKILLQLLFSEVWYPLFGIIMLFGHLLPIIAVFSHQPWVSVSYLDYITFSIPISFSILAIVWFMKKNGWLRPHYSPIICWEVALFMIIRWPWALYGSIMGIVMVIRKKQVHFKVTPKGANVEPSLKWPILYPYMAIILISFIPSILEEDAGDANGYYLFLILTLLMYTVALLSIIIIHKNESFKQNYKGEK